MGTELIAQFLQKQKSKLMTVTNVKFNTRQLSTEKMLLTNR